MFVFVDKFFDILPINELFTPDLNIRQLTVPDLAAPEPFGCADITDELFD
jgi:hypothetical protein